MLHLVKKLLDLISYYSDGDNMYADFKAMYYEVRYVNPKSKFNCENRSRMILVCGYIYIFVFPERKKINKQTEGIMYM